MSGLDLIRLTKFLLNENGACAEAAHVAEASGDAGLKSTDAHPSPLINAGEQMDSRGTFLSLSQYKYSKAITCEMDLDKNKL